MTERVFQCNWDPNSQACSFADTEDLANEVGGKEKCQFFKKGKCLQAKYEADEEEQVTAILEDYHNNPLHQETLESLAKSISSNNNWEG